METYFDDLSTRPHNKATLVALAALAARESRRAAYDAAPDDEAPTVAFVMRPVQASNNGWTDCPPRGEERAGARPAEAPASTSTSTSTDNHHGPDQDPASILEIHARAELAAGRAFAARAFCERAMALRRARYGEADVSLPASFCNLGAIALHANRVDDAIWHFEQAYDLVVRRSGGESPELASIYNNLGVIARRRGDHDLARSHYEAALAIKVERYGWEHRSVALSLVNLGRVAEAMGDLGVAGESYSRARVVAERTEGAVGPALAASLLGLGRVYLSRGEDVLAHFAFERALRIREAIPCPPLQLASARFAFALSLAPSAPSEAELLMRRALRDYRATDAARPEVIEYMADWLELHESTLDDPARRCR